MLIDRLGLDRRTHAVDQHGDIVTGAILELPAFAAEDDHPLADLGDVGDMQINAVEELRSGAAECALGVGAQLVPGIRDLP